MVERLPRHGNPIDAQTLTRHTELVNRYLVKIASCAETAIGDMEKVEESHLAFHLNFKSLYVHPLGNCSTGRFVLKRDRGDSEALPEVHDINVTMRQSPGHDKVSRRVMDNIKAAYIAKYLKPNATAQERKTIEDKAELSIKSAHHQQYNVYHPALVAASMSDLKELDLDEAAQDALEALPSAKAMLIVALVVRILSSIEENFYRPNFDNVNVGKELLPSLLPQDEQAQKIVIFCHHTSVCILLARVLTMCDVGLLNLFGRNTGNVADCIERRANTCPVPILFISLAMAIGINITQAIAQ